MSKIFFNRKKKESDLDSSLKKPHKRNSAKKYSTEVGINFQPNEDSSKQDEDRSVTPTILDSEKSSNSGGSSGGVKESLRQRFVSVVEPSSGSDSLHLSFQTPRTQGRNIAKTSPAFFSRGSRFSFFHFFQLQQHQNIFRHRETGSGKQALLHST